jgi:hypothetical protein
MMVYTGSVFSAARQMFKNAALITVSDVLKYPIYAPKDVLGPIIPSRATVCMIIINNMDQYNIELSVLFISSLFLFFLKFDMSQKSGHKN